MQKGLKSTESRMYVHLADFTKEAEYNMSLWLIVSNGGLTNPRKKSIRFSAATVLVSILFASTPRRVGL